MKVHWYDRVLMFFVACFLLAGAVLFFALQADAVCANVSLRIGNLPIDETGRMLLLGGGVILVVLSVYLFATALHKRRRPPVRGVLVRSGEMGAVEITLSALDTLIQKSVRGFSAVRDCVSAMNVAPSGELDVQLRLALLPDTDVPDLSKQLQEEVKQFVESHAGVTVRQIAVLVESTGVNPAARVQ